MYTGVNILCVIYLIKSAVLTRIEVIPSNNVYENQIVEITCHLENATGAIFNFPDKRDCNVYKINTTCNKCLNYEARCINDFTYTVNAAATKDWNNKTVYCDKSFGGKQSNSITFDVKVPVTNVSLQSPNKIAVNVEQQINLTCTTDFCNPAATIAWYKDSSPITDSNIITITDTNSDSLKKKTSVFPYKGVKSDHLQQVYCQASNMPNVTVVSDKHFLDIKYPPSSTPLISLSPPGLMYNTGKNVTLSCQLSGGNPLATILLTCDGQSLSQSDLNNETTAISEVNFQIDSSYNNRTCICRGVHQAQLTDTLSNITLFVNVPVTSVTLSPDKIVVNDSQQINLTCTTNFCNPAATITWYIGSAPIRDGSIFTISDTGAFSLKKTTSVFQYKGVGKDNMQLVFCTAYNSHSMMVNSKKYRLDVRYPPSSDPEISAVPPNFIYDDGTLVNLTCHLYGGNPVANLLLECNTLKGAYAVNENSTAVSVLSVAVNKSYNNQNCSCLASHQLFNRSRSTQKKLVVFYNNIITSTFVDLYEVNETQRLQLECIVDGNPLSNIQWIFVKNNSVLKTERNKSISSFDIYSAKCIDHGEYEVRAENGRDFTARSRTKIAVKCKPRLYTIDSQTSDKIGIGNNVSLRINVRILLYPHSKNVQWNFTRVNESKIISDDSEGFRIEIKRKENEENITLFKEKMTNEDFGNYTIIVKNEVGMFNRNFQVSSARSPSLPTNMTIFCDNPSAISLTWISNFNGGSSQNFDIFYSTNGNMSSFTLLKKNISDEGYGRLHKYLSTIELYGNLWFKITATNKFGGSTTNTVYCFLKELDSSSSNELAMITGVAAGSGLILAIGVVVVVYLRRYIKQEKHAGQSQRLHHDGESDDTNDDGMKDNILYVSAGPKVDEKPEAAVYAAVNKKVSESNNNANVYAEVNKGGNIIAEGALYSDVKPKRGLFKKDLSHKKDGNPKQKKWKKQKSKQDVADVYENSEDIPMSSKSDNVYSNTGQKVQNKEDRGYKNKDGLLYVEVQFDHKTEKGNQTIHGEDEKTDYATVEFPMAASTHGE